MEIQILLANGTFIKLTDCKSLCDIEMSEVSAMTGLKLDSLIQVRVRAKNEIGWGPYSELNTKGATIETEPEAMQKLTATYTSATIIKLSWATPTGTNKGGSQSQISSYEL